MKKERKTNMVSPGHKHGIGKYYCIFILRKWESEKKNHELNH